MFRMLAAFIALTLLSACSYYSLSRGAGCFAAGTLVKTPDGWIAIEDLKPNDEVISFDEETGAFTVGIVETVTEQPAHAILHVSLGTEEEIQVTGDHPVLTAERTWVPIG